MPPRHGLSRPAFGREGQTTVDDDRSLEQSHREVRRIERGTGLSWSRVVACFEDAGGKAVNHGDLAAAVHGLMQETGVENPGWWAQGATVAYEKQIGRRVVGQSSTGDFQVAASRTVDVGDRGGKAGVRDAAAVVVSRSERCDVVGDPRISDTPKRSYWRCGLSDGTSLEIAVAGAPSGGSGGGTPRAAVTLTVTRMNSADQREAVRKDLKAILSEL